MSTTVELLATLVLDDGRRWGDAATSAQWSDAVAVLDPDGPPYHFLTRARGYSKSTDLAGITLAAMLTQLPAGARAYALASDRDQGRLLADAMAGFVARTPGLASLVVVDQYRATAATGVVFEVLAADAPGAYGLRPSFLVVDELAQWATTPAPRALWEAVTSAMTKVAGSRMVVLTSAGDPAHWAHKVLVHAGADPLWRVHEVPGPAPWSDPVRLAEQRRRLMPATYARLFENAWTAPEDRLTNAGDVAACVTHSGPLAAQPHHSYAIGVDVGVTNDATVAVVAHAEDDAGRRRVVVDRIEAWVPRPGSPVQLGDVECWLLEAHRSYGSPTLVVDPWQALSLAQRLRSAGVRVEEFTFSAQSVGRLALTLHRLLAERLVALPDDAELPEELASVRLRETSPGNYRLDHDAGAHDDRAIALALAAFHLVEVPSTMWVDLATHRDRGWYTSDGQFMPPSSWLLDPDRVGF